MKTAGELEWHAKSNGRTDGGGQVFWRRNLIGPGSELGPLRAVGGQDCKSCPWLRDGQFDVRRHGEGQSIEQAVYRFIDLAVRWHA